MLVWVITTMSVITHTSMCSTANNQQYFSKQARADLKWFFSHLRVYSSARKHLYALNTNKIPHNHSHKHFEWQHLLLFFCLKSAIVELCYCRIENKLPSPNKRFLWQTWGFLLLPRLHAVILAAALIQTPSDGTAPTLPRYPHRWTCRMDPGSFGGSQRTALDPALMGSDG